jgi:hypothetical protein
MSLPSAASIAPFIADDPRSFRELVKSCRKFIGAWVEADCDLADPLVNEFVSIDSQADEVGLWGRNREEDEADFYQTFYAPFIEARDDVRRKIIET